MELDTINNANNNNKMIILVVITRVMPLYEQSLESANHRVIPDG